MSLIARLDHGLACSMTLLTRATRGGESSSGLTNSTVLFVLDTLPALRMA